MKHLKRTMVRKLLAIIGIFTGLTLHAQIDCQISYTIDNEPDTLVNDTVLCKKQVVHLFTTFSDTLNYLWLPGGQTTHEIDITVDFIEQQFELIISNQEGTVLCGDLLELESYILTDEVDTLFWYKSPLTLGRNSDPDKFVQWRPGKDSDTTEVFSFEILDTTTYYLDVYSRTGMVLLCTDSIKYYTYPRMYVEFDQTSKGCPDECKAQVYAIASEGFPPYRYRWDDIVDVAPNDSSLALGLCSEDTYKIRIYDTICAFDTSYLVESYKLPDVTISYSPDTIYFTNPKAEFSFENETDTIALTNWVWLFPDSTTTNDEIATHVFQDTASVVSFIYTTENGCIDTVRTEVPLRELDIEIPNVFTPNGDGANETWEIPDLEKYISSDLVVFDRWGKKVHEALNYTGNWDGGKLGDGVYFYVLKCQGYWREEVYKGSVTIIGSKY